MINSQILGLNVLLVVVYVYVKIYKEMLFQYMIDDKYFKWDCSLLIIFNVQIGFICINKNSKVILSFILNN